MLSKKIISAFEFLQNIVWGSPTIIIFLLVGIIFSIKLNFFHIKHFKHILGKTIFSVFKNKKTEKNELTPFETLASTLSATLGTGSIAGVSTALVTGGVGAIFWMWISAIIGAAISYVENLLGMYYREKNNRGEWCGGAMYCLKNGFKNRKVALVLGNLFGFFTILASFGIGCSVQTNTVAASLTAFGSEISKNTLGVALALTVFFAVAGGTKIIAKISSVLMPVMFLIYFVGTVSIILKNINLLPKIFLLIFKTAFGINPIVGGFCGSMAKKAVSFGIRRGVFSNEAGMGSTVLINSSSSINSPVLQGMWGIFEVVFDTLVVCSLTAFAILSSGVFDLNTGELLVLKNGAELVVTAFKNVWGNYAAVLVSISNIFFAFSSILGWSFYGIKCTEFVLGRAYITSYKIIFSIFAYLGTVFELSFIWLMSDVFNGLMIIPNFICIVLLSPVAFKLSDDYVKQNIAVEK